VEFEEGHFTSSNIGDPSSLTLLGMNPVILSEAKDLLRFLLGGVGGGDFSLLH
jgi:hypothetical protein